MLGHIRAHQHTIGIKDQSISKNIHGNSTKWNINGY